MKIKRVLIFVSVLIFLSGISVLSYNYAIWKTKKYILKNLKNLFDSEVKGKNLNLSLSNFSFEELSFRGVNIRNFFLAYNIFALFTFKNAGVLEVEEVSVDIDSISKFLEKKRREEKSPKGEKGSDLIFLLNKGNIKRLILVFRGKEYVFENVNFSINIYGREYQVYGYFYSPGLYSFRGEINLSGKGRLFKIFTHNFKSDLFDLKFKVVVDGDIFKVSVFNSNFKNLEVYKLEGRGFLKENYIEFTEFDISSNYLNLNSHFSLKDNTISGYASGNFNYNVYKGAFQSNFKVDIKKELFSGELRLKNLNYKNFSFDEVFYKGLIQKSKILLPDSINISSEFLKGYGRKKDDILLFKIEKLNSKLLSEFLPHELTPDFNVKGTGILKIKKKDFELLMQGLIENFIFKDLKSEFINFSFNRKDKVNELSFYLGELHFKKADISLDLLKLKFVHPESTSFEIKGFFPLIGDLDEEGYIVKKDKNIQFFLSRGNIFLNPYPERVNIDSFKFLNGYLSFEGEDKRFRIRLIDGDLSYIPFLDLSGKINLYGNLVLSDSSKIKSIEGNFKINSFYYKWFNIDSVRLFFIDTCNLVKGEGYFFKDGQKGVLNLSYSPFKFYFEVYGNDFDIRDMNPLLGEYFKFEKGDFDFNLEGEIEYKEGVRYNAEMSCERVKGVFYPAGVIFDNLHIYLTFRNDTFSYDFTGTSGRGKLSGGGIGVMGFYDTQFLIGGKVRLTNITIYPISNIEANVSGEINYRSDNRGLYIDGDLFIDRCFIYPSFEEGEKEGKFSKTKINLNLEGDNIFITSEYFNAELKGNLIIFSPDFKERVYSGKLEVKRGNVFYLGRVFEIKGNSYILLRGAESFDPELYINAETDYTDQERGEKVKIVIELRGNLSTPKFILKTEPPLYTETEIIKMLTLGSEIPGSFIIEGTISQEIRKRLKLKELLITGLLRGDPTFTIGTYVSENIYLRYSQGITNFSRNLYLIKYFILPSLSIYAEKDEKGSLHSGLEFEFRF